MILTDTYGVTLMIIVNMTKGRIGFRKGGKVMGLERRGFLQPNLPRICQGVDLGSCKMQIMQVLLKINVLICSISVRF